MPFINAIGLKNFVLYVVIINIVAFCAMWIDKRKAEKGAWRIPESTLMAFALLGGGIGGIAGMYKFRHKTKKPKFYIGMPAILILEIIALIFIGSYQ